MSKSILVGTSQMAIDYEKVLQALNNNHSVVGRSAVGCDLFKEKTGIDPIPGGLELYLKDLEIGTIAEAIVAVGVEQLYNCAVQLLEHGCKRILLEKPGCITEQEFKSLNELCNKHKAEVYIAYNRRYYASVLRAKEILDEDGGVTSFNFEFTEWSHKIEPLKKQPGVKENWFLGNSTHVVDMAFFLGGNPTEMSCFSGGVLSWHSKSIFGGAGMTKEGAIFSYNANWESAGRWSVEVLTKKRKLIFCPLEGLKQQIRGTIGAEDIEIDNDFDVQYKPGLYKQVEAFISRDSLSLKSLSQQLKDYYLYNRILLGKH